MEWYHLFTHWSYVRDARKSAAKVVQCAPWGLLPGCSRRYWPRLDRLPRLPDQRFGPGGVHGW